MNEAARSSSLTADAIRRGAVVSFDGETLVASGGAIVDAVASRLASPAAAHADDRWLIAGAVPVLARGEAWIVPLAWIPETASDPAMLRTRADELRRAIFSACEYLHGWPIALGLPEGPGTASRYVAELRRTGAVSAEWWGFDRHAVVRVAYGESAAAAAHALHVVPLGWVSERRPAKRIGALDLGWGWADAVAAAQAGAA